MVPLKKLFMPTETKLKSKGKRARPLIGPDGHPVRPEAGIQISLRLPRPVLAKLTRLSDAAVQSKSQYITKMVAEIPEPV
jgi:hypothetical protein